MAIVDCAVYVKGARVHDAVSVHEAVERAERSGGFAWVGLLRPSDEEIETVAEAFGVHALAVEDAKKGHQRSKLERYGHNLALVVRAARYDELEEAVDFGDIHLFVTPTAVVSVRLADEPDLSDVRSRLESEQQLLSLGPSAVLYALLDQVVDSYAPVVAGLENDIDEVEDQIFGEQVASSVSRRIYALHREVIGFQRAVEPLAGMLEELRAIAAADDADIELRRHFRDVHDHVIRVADRIENFRSLLDNALTTHLALVGHRQTEASLDQNEQTKMISAWAAVLYAPTLVGTIYGMNFTHMPELHWVYGYPLSLGIMAILSGALFAVFKRLRWL